MFMILVKDSVLARERHLDRADEHFGYGVAHESIENIGLIDAGGVNKPPSSPLDLNRTVSATRTR
jgi:hypothetical protein